MYDSFGFIYDFDLKIWKICNRYLLLTVFYIHFFEPFFFQFNSQTTMTMRIEEKSRAFAFQKKKHHDQVFLWIEEDDECDEWQSVTSKRFLSVIHVQENRQE